TRGRTMARHSSRGRRSGWGAGLCLLTVGTLGIAACSRDHAGTTSSTVTTAAATPAAAVTTVAGPTTAAPATAPAAAAAPVTAAPGPPAPDPAATLQQAVEIGRAHV